MYLKRLFRLYEINNCYKIVLLLLSPYINIFSSKLIKHYSDSQAIEKIKSLRYVITSRFCPTPNLHF